MVDGILHKASAAKDCTKISHSETEGVAPGGVVARYGLNIRSQGSSGAIDFLSHAGYSAPLSGCSVAW